MGKTKKKKQSSSPLAEKAAPVSTRKDFITLASVIAALSVMLLHTNNCFWWMNVGDSRWPFANIIETVFYFAAPLYFMISGATLMNYRDRYSTGQYFAKRALKILPAFFAWNFAALLYQAFYKKTVVFANVTLLDFIKGAFSSQYLGIYWFLPAIICVYLVLPLFAAVEKDKRRKIFTYFVLVCLVCNKLIPLIITLFKWEFPWPFADQGIWLNYVVYAVLGYLISEYEAPAWMRWTVYGLALAAMILHGIGTLEDSRNIGSVSYLLKGYEKLPSYLYAAGVFLFVKEISDAVMKWKPLRVVVEKMAKYTFVTYLMHWYLMEMFLDAFHAKWFTNLFGCAPIDVLVVGSNLWYRLLTPFLLYAVCMGVAWVLRKIPLVKHIVP